MYLEGKQINPKDSVGKLVMYLRKCDIDKSGRGYFFPQVDKKFWDEMIIFIIRNYCLPDHI